MSLEIDYHDLHKRLNTIHYKVKMPLNPDIPLGGCDELMARSQEMGHSVVEKPQLFQVKSGNIYSLSSHREQKEQRSQNDFYAQTKAQASAD